MSDHVALSADQISQSGERAELQAGHRGSTSESGASVFNPPFDADADATAASGSVSLSYDREIKTKEINVVGNHVAEARVADLALEIKECSSCPSNALSDLNSMREEAALLPKGDHDIVDSSHFVEEDHDKVDCNHVVVPVENGLHCEKKNMDSPSLAECRICQEEDDITNLESPCACSGSLKFAHRKCVQHWCNEKGDTSCEICQKPFQGGYATPQQGRADNIVLDLGASWDIASGQPRLFALATDHRFLESDYDEYAGSHAHSAACFRSVALILVALLLLRHIMSMTGVNEDEDLTTFFMLSFVRAAGFLIPCYIMVRALNALQIRHQQEASIAAAAEVTHLIQTGQIQAVVAAEP